MTVIFSTVSGVRYEPSAVYVPSLYAPDEPEAADGAGDDGVLPVPPAPAVPSASFAVGEPAQPARSRTPAMPASADPWRTEGEMFMRTASTSRL